MRILAYREVGVQRHLLADGGQVVEGGHRRIDLVTDAVDVDQQLRRLLVEDAAAQQADHSITSRCRTCRSCMRRRVSR